MDLQPSVPLTLLKYSHMRTEGEWMVAMMMRLRSSTIFCRCRQISSPITLSSPLVGSSC
jgi:hypothetical protein